MATIGVRKSAWRGPTAMRRIRAGAPAAITSAAELLRGASLAEVPIDTTALAQSAAVIPATEETLEAAVTYDTPYAVRQHWEADWHHSEGKSHYLSDPLRDKTPELLAIQAKGIRRALGK